VADAGAARLHSLGLPRPRAETLVAVARAVAESRVRLGAGQDPITTRQELLGIEGVSRELATMVVMRALSWPDAYPIDDPEWWSTMHGPRAPRVDGERWRPWRAYAFLHRQAGRAHDLVTSCSEGTL
jgi:AraC family transcriptional regulator of adaptative response / DNA-3-methyladenine glycosylase II